MKTKTIEKIMFSCLDIPNHKIIYVITQIELLKGLWGMIKAYGVEFSEENHEILIDVVQTKLEGTEDIEREWSEVEYKTFVLYKE